MHSYDIDKRSFFFHTAFYPEISKRGPYYAPIVDGIMLFSGIFSDELLGKYVRNRLMTMLSENKIIPNIDVIAGFNADESALFAVWAFMFYNNVDPEFLNSTLGISFGKENVEKIFKIYQEKSKTNLELMEHVNTDCFFGRPAKVRY